MRRLPALLGPMVAWALACLAAPAQAGGEQGFEQIAKGRALVTAADCAACHTLPGGPDFAGGRAIATPFGTLLAPNLTPDRDTGIGAWSDDDFVRAVREGIGPGGEHYYPAFPYQYFARMTRADVVAMRRYLATLEPVANKVHSNQLPFPYNMRWIMAVWNALFFATPTPTDDPGRSAEWNRGAYLAQGPGHCAACHTAKNFLGGDMTGRSFRGGRLGEWFAPDITNDGRTGLGSWRTEDVADYLATGHNAAAAASGPMSEVITLSTSRMDPADLRAIAVFLKSLPGRDATAAPLSTASTGEGKRIYDAQCAACHQSSGAGVPNLFPTLANAPGPQAEDAINAIRVILEGGRSVATAAKPTAPAMPAFGWKLSDAQVAAVATYVRNSWGNAAPAVTGGEVATTRASLAAPK